MSEPLSITAPDGFLISATRFEPAAPTRGWVVLTNAMGVKQDFYQPLARWLAEQGFSALTWDYRGLGASRPAPSEVSMLDWAEKDIEGVLQWALAQGAPVTVLGHSLGAQLVGLAPSAVKIAGIVGVGAQLGDWRYWPFPYNVGMLLLASVLLPGISGLFGKLPKGLMGEELPKRPVVEWSRWIRSKGYLLSEGEWVAERFARITCPMTAFSISDDRYAPRASVDALCAAYKNAAVKRLHVTPQEVGVKRLGHFGPFRSTMKASFWPMLLAQLRGQALQLAQ